MTPSRPLDSFSIEIFSYWPPRSKGKAGNEVYWCGQQSNDAYAQNPNKNFGYKRSNNPMMTMYEVPIITLDTKGQWSFLVGKHIDVLWEWLTWHHQERTWMLCSSSQISPYVYLYNKIVIAPSWVLWITLVNYQTWGESCELAKLVASWSDAWVARGNTYLNPRLLARAWNRGNPVEDSAFNLRGIC